MQGCCARLTASLRGLEHDSRDGEGGGRARRCHGKGQLGSGGLAGCLNFTPHDWEANKGFKTAVTTSGWAFVEDDTTLSRVLLGCCSRPLYQVVCSLLYNFIFAILVTHRTFSHHLRDGKGNGSLGKQTTF